jgi:hypothetical protein
MRRPANGLVKGHRWAARLWTVVKKENWPELLALTSIFFLELPGIEPVSGCWSLSEPALSCEMTPIVIHQN